MAKTVVIARVQVEGIHRWPDAPGYVYWLRHPHHHTFHVTVWRRVEGVEREVEIITLGHVVEQFFAKRYGAPVAQFDTMSCEAIAEVLLNEFALERAEVLEDGRHGAAVSR